MSTVTDGGGGGGGAYLSSFVEDDNDDTVVVVVVLVVVADEPTISIFDLDLAFSSPASLPGCKEPFPLTKTVTYG